MMDPHQQDYQSAVLVATAFVMSSHHQEQHLHLSCSAFASQASVYSSLLQLDHIRLVPKMRYCYALVFWVQL